MPTNVEVPGQGVVEFPDGMSNDDIARVIKQHAAAQTPAAGSAASGDTASVGGFARNAIGSAGHFVGDLASAALHPIDTVKGVANVAAGAVNAGGKALGVIDAAKESPGAKQSDAAFSGFVQSLKDRYGSIDKLAHTLYTDPVGAVADLSSVAGGVEGLAGKAADLADMAKAGDAARVARQTASVAGKTAAATNPLTVPAAAVTKAVDVGTDAAARRLYASALKPSKAMSVENFDKAIDTGLANKIVPGSRESYERLQGLLGDVRDKIDQGIAARPNATANPADVATRVDQMRGQFQTVNPVSDLRDIDRAKQEFLNQFSSPAPQPSGILGPNGQPIPAPAATPPRQMTLREMQDMKMKTNALLDGKYGEQSTAAVEAQKALVRGLKEEAEKLFPELSSLNKQQAGLIALEPALEASIKRAATRDLVPFGDGVTGTARKVLDDPHVKARIAIALENTPSFGKGSGLTVGKRLALVDARVKDYLDSLSGIETGGGSGAEATAAQQK